MFNKDSSEDHNLVIIFNKYIYNWIELNFKR